MRGLPQASTRTTLLAISRFDGAPTDKKLAEATGQHVARHPARLRRPGRARRRDINQQARRGVVPSSPAARHRLP